MSVCVANIGRRGRRRRLLVGGCALGVALALAIMLVWTGAARAWRLLLFPALWMAGIGFFQYREKT